MKDRDYDRERGHDRDRERDRNRERDREREGGRERGRDGDRRSGHSYGYDDGPSGRYPPRDRERERERDEGSDKTRDRDRDRDRETGRDKVRDNDRGDGRPSKKALDDSRPSGIQRVRSRSRSRSRSPPSKRHAHQVDKRGNDGDGGRIGSRMDELPPSPLNDAAGQASGPVAPGGNRQLAGELEHHEDGLPDSVAAMEEAAKAIAKKKEEATFELSGALAAETNLVNGVALTFVEPPEARKPTVRWRFYVFKGPEPLKEPLYIHRKSCYLAGRDRKVADIPTDHPSCSKQHAVVQYRLTEKEGLDGMMQKKVRPYIMDLGSTNGTFLNGKQLEPQRYYELMEKDNIRFGNSSRDYVILHEGSAL